MNQIQSKIRNLENLLASEVNEERLLEAGEAGLVELRAAWLKEKGIFSNDDIARLQAIRDILETVEGFVEAQEIIPRVHSEEEFTELVDELFSFCDDVMGLPVEGRIRKEIRELNERYPRLTSSEELKKGDELTRAVALLNSRAPTCGKCYSNMVIREGRGKYFWGCERFPDCWGRRWLKTEELDLLP
jgi:hypothetical protein